MVKPFRVLPYPPVKGKFTPEIVAEIKAIPDEKIEYTESELRWLRRALENLDCMFEHAQRLLLEESLLHIAKRMAWITSALRKTS